MAVLCALTPINVRRYERIMDITVPMGNSGSTVWVNPTLYDFPVCLFVDDTITGVGSNALDSGLVPKPGYYLGAYGCSRWDNQFWKASYTPDLDNLFHNDLEVVSPPPNIYYNPTQKFDCMIVEVDAIGSMDLVGGMEVAYAKPTNQKAKNAYLPGMNPSTSLKPDFMSVVMPGCKKFRCVMTAEHGGLHFSNYPELQTQKYFVAGDDDVVSGSDYFPMLGPIADRYDLETLNGFPYTLLVRFKRQTSTQTNEVGTNFFRFRLTQCCSIAPVFRRPRFYCSIPPQVIWPGYANQWVNTQRTSTNFQYTVDDTAHELYFANPFQSGYRSGDELVSYIVIWLRKIKRANLHTQLALLGCPYNRWRGKEFYLGFVRYFKNRHNEYPDEDRVN